MRYIILLLALSACASKSNPNASAVNNGLSQSAISWCPLYYQAGPNCVCEQPSGHGDLPNLTAQYNNTTCAALIANAIATGDK